MCNVSNLLLRETKHLCMSSEDPSAVIHKGDAIPLCKALSTAEYMLVHKDGVDNKRRPLVGEAFFQKFDIVA